MVSARRCIAQCKDGRPCRAWAMRDSEPALCATHRRPAKEKLPATRPVDEASPAPGEATGFYDEAYSMQEVADLMRAAAEGDLSDEMTAARIAVRRVLRQLEEELSPAEYARTAGLIFQGTNTIARLARAHRDLSREAAEEWAKAIARALDEAGREMGVPL